MIIIILFAFIVLAVLAFQYQPKKSSPDAEIVALPTDRLVVTSFVGLGLALMGNLLLVAGYFLTIAIAFLICWKLSFRRGVYVVLCLLLGVPFCVSPIQESMSFRNETMAAKAEFPFESIESRLSYEPKEIEGDLQQRRYYPPFSFSEWDINRTFLERPLVALRPQELSSEQLMSGFYEKYLLEWAAKQVWQESAPPRSLALFTIHELSERRFQAMMGAGFMRMPWMRNWKDQLIELPPPEDLYLPDEYTPADQFADALTWARGVMELISPSTKVTPELRAHLRSYIDFVNLEGWGYVRSRDEVAGFQSHHFRHRPIVYNTETKELDDWRIVRLQLVSVLKHESPRVYLDSELPNMEKLSSENALTRELDDFESRALKHLQQDTDVVLKENGDSLRMMGSLRAIENCRDCHHVRHGDLLGAFSYELRRAPRTVSAREGG